MTAQPTNTPADEAPYWDAALETQTRADWDAMKLELLKAHLQHAYQRLALLPGLVRYRWRASRPGQQPR